MGKIHTREDGTKYENFGLYIDRCESLTIGQIARLQSKETDGVARLYDEDGELETMFIIKRITDGRGRYWQCDGKLKIWDRVFEFSDYPLEWRPSHLGRGGHWVIVGAGHYARKLYRTAKGWRTREEYENLKTYTDSDGRERHKTLYRKQDYTKKAREGRGWPGIVALADLEDDLAAVWQPRRKWHYKGKPTPYARKYYRMEKKLERMETTHRRNRFV